MNFFLHPVLQLSYSRQFATVHTNSGFGDLHRLLKITIQSVTCPTTSKHHAELIDMKTFTPPIGRMGCLLSCIRTSPVPYQAFASHSCTKLSFPKCISPPERCHWGLWHTSGGLKMFLTDWPLHLFPEVTQCCPSCKSTGKMYTQHFQLPRPSLTLWHACIMFDIADF